MVSQLDRKKERTMYLEADEVPCCDGSTQRCHLAQFITSKTDCLAPTFSNKPPPMTKHNMLLIAEEFFSRQFEHGEAREAGAECAAVCSCPPSCGLAPRALAAYDLDIRLSRMRWLNHPSVSSWYSRVLDRSALGQ